MSQAMWLLPPRKEDTKLKIHKRLAMSLVLQSSGLIEHFKSLSQGMAADSLYSAGPLVSFWIFSSQGQGYLDQGTCYRVRSLVFHNWDGKGWILFGRLGTRTGWRLGRLISGEPWVHATRFSFMKAWASIL